MEKSDLQEKLLADQGLQIEEMESAWDISESELTAARPLDSGAFGEVFVAKWRDVPVAVKRIRAGAMELNADAASEFLHEIKFMRTLRHANVVLFFGCGRGPDGLPFLVAEYLLRGSLKGLLANASVELTSSQKISFARGKRCRGFYCERAPVFSPHGVGTQMWRRVWSIFTTNDECTGRFLRP